MQKIRVIAASGKKVIRGGVAQVLNSSQSIEMVGRDSEDMLEEAFELQPDVLV